MGEWQRYSLSSIADIRISNVDKKSVFGETPVLLCNYMDVYSNDYITQSIEFMEATANLVEIEKFKIAKGDVLITKDSETPYDIGIPSVVVDEIDKLVCAYHLALIKPNHNAIDPLFLSKQLASPEVASYFSRLAAGSTRYGLSNGAIARTVIRAPSLAKQQKIAHILQTIDRAIEHTEALIDKYQQIKAGLMHDLFTRGIGPDGQLRPPRDQAPDLYQQTPIGWIPKEWEVCSVGSLSTLMTNGFVGTATPFYSEDSDAVQYLYGNNIRANRIDLTGMQRVQEKFHLIQRKSQLSEGDMLTVQSGHIGTSAVVPPDLGPANCHALIITRFKDGAVVPEYVSHYLNSNIGMNRLSSIFVGSTILHINTSALYKFDIPLPKLLDEQILIYKKLCSFQLLIDRERDHVYKLQKQKSGLMHDLLTGKVPVTVDAATPEAAHG